MCKNINFFGSEPFPFTKQIPLNRSSTLVRETKVLDTRKVTVSPYSQSR